MAAPVPPGDIRPNNQRNSGPPNYFPGSQGNANALADNMQNLSMNRPPGSGPRPPPPFGQSPQPFPQGAPSYGAPQRGPSPMAARPGPPHAGMGRPSGPPPGAQPSGFQSNVPLGRPTGPPSSQPPFGSRPSMPGGPVAQPGVSASGFPAFGPSGPPPGARPMGFGSPPPPVGSSAMSMPPSGMLGGPVSNGPPQAAGSGGFQRGPQFPGAAVSTPQASYAQPPASPFTRPPPQPLGAHPLSGNSPLSASVAPSMPPPPATFPGAPYGRPAVSGSPYGPPSGQVAPPPLGFPGQMQPPRYGGMGPLPNQSMTTIPSAMGQPGAPVPGPSRIDPNQIPRPGSSSSPVVFEPEHRDTHWKRSRPQSDDDDDTGSKRRHRGSDDRDSLAIDTVFRYLCPVKKIGSVIGRGGDIVKQLRMETRAKIKIGEAVTGCDERVVTIFSASDETNEVGDGERVLLSPAQDALFRVHDRVVAADGGDGSDGEKNVTAKMLVPSDQIGCVLGRGGQVVQNIRSETGAHIRIIKDRNMPLCALSSDELIQISGEVMNVKKALHQIASRLHENPSRTQNILSSAPPLMSHACGSRIVGIAPLMDPYSRDLSRPLYQALRNDPPAATDFYIRLVSPADNIASVIGKGGALINQLRQETRATIKVDSARTEGNDCLITISAREVFDDAYSPTIEAAMRLQSKCSDKVERDSGLVSFTTRLLVPSSRIGCLLGKGGAIITEMRRMTKANIRVLGKDNLPKVASGDDEMVQISGEFDVAKDALIQITSRLRANVFDREGSVSTLMPVLPYVPVALDAGDRLDYDRRDSRRPERSNHYPGGYGSSGLSEGYSRYGAPVGGSSSSSTYGVYGGYASGRSGSSGLSSHSSSHRRRNYDY